MFLSLTANTIWSILPPLIAIGLALATKEVLSSLMIGVLAGALFYSNFNVLNAINLTFSLMGEKLGDNASIVLFLCFLGVLVVLMTKAGGSKAYGAWASKKIKSRRGAMLATSALGALIFVDDYFNCLTVGTVMRPVTDAHQVSRTKLAYIIDSTAAPICIIAPISSWAIAVGGTITDAGLGNGFAVFLQTIPYNLYAILTIIMVLSLSFFAFDFGKMKKFEKAAIENNDLHSHNGEKMVHQMEDVEVSSKGKVIDLVLPVALLIASTLSLMIFTGVENIGIANAEGGNIPYNVIEIFGNCSVNISIVMSGFIAIVFAMALYLPRKIITFNAFMKSVTEGIKSMVPAITILVLAWTLSGICSPDYMMTGNFVGGLIEESGLSLSLMPAIIFVVAGILGFSTGTSWGTFGILIPILVVIFSGSSPELMVITISATLAGAVFGDHVSPISDTTILSSTGAECNHIDHVRTQLPYASIVAAACFAGYLVAGIWPQAGFFLPLGVSAIILAVTLIVVKKMDNKA